MIPNRMTCVLLLAGFAFGLTGCGAKSEPPKAKKVPAPKPPEPPKAAEPPAPPTEPAPAAVAVVFAPPVVREKIAAGRAAASQTVIRLTGIRSSKPWPTKDQALADALNVARTDLMKQLEALEPPVHARPSMVTMKTEYLKGEVREILPSESEKQAIKDNKLSPNVRWVEIDLELTELQVQRLRSSERVTDAFRVGGLLFALLAAGYAFLRLDQWTKGYLTMWLGLGAAAIVVCVGLLVFS